MQPPANSFKYLYVLQPLSKGFSIFFFVMLPVFFAQNIITSKQLGYIGAVLIAMLILGAVLVVSWWHNMATKNLLLVAGLIALASSILLLIGSFQHNLILLFIAYAGMGLATGTALSGVNALAARFTKRGDRYYSLAKVGSVTDVVRIVFPILVASMVAIGNSNAAIFLIILATLIFLVYSAKIQESLHAVESEEVLSEKLRTNRVFRFVMTLEFADSFSSSQLFVYLPLLFLAKGFTLQKSLILQSFIFLGYLSGRWLVSYFAKHYSAAKSIAYAEVGMIICIGLLLVSRQLWVLYVLSFILGIFARGTSPTIKAMAFDALNERQMKKGSAVHVIAGDSGSAIGQLLFGFMIAWFGINAPFIVAAGVAGLIAVACIARQGSLAKKSI